MTVIAVTLLLISLLIYLIYFTDVPCDFQRGGSYSTLRNNLGEDIIRSPYSQLQQGAEFLDRSDKYAKYPSLCLTRNPYGFPHQESGHLYWSAYKPQLIQPEQPDREQTKNETLLKRPQYSQKVSPSVPDDYYRDPEAFCRNNPNSYPCENFWIKGNEKHRQHIVPMSAYVEFPNKDCKDRHVPCPKLDLCSAQKLPL